MLPRLLFFVIPRLLLLHIVRAHGPDNDNAELPNSSAEFFASFSCDGLPARDPSATERDDPFVRWVLSARHTTWRRGWEVAAPPRSDDDGDVAGGDGEKYYARVFDLLNWARKRDLLPVPVDVSSICHKGMEARCDATGIGRADGDAPATTPGGASVPSDTWSDLWEECREQLSSATRLSSSCIDVPGVLVADPGPPWIANNPCRREYRMVDGAHRICLRKYLLALLTGELAELVRLAEGDVHENPAGDVHARIRRKRRLIERTSRGFFLVMNQTTFRSVLTSSDPHASWAKSEDILMKDVTQELRLDWERWMSRVMGRVAEGKNECCVDERRTDFAGDDAVLETKSCDTTDQNYE